MVTEKSSITWEQKVTELPPSVQEITVRHTTYLKRIDKIRLDSDMANELLGRSSGSRYSSRANDICHRVL